MQHWWWESIIGSFEFGINQVQSHTISKACKLNEFEFPSILYRFIKIVKIPNTPIYKYVMYSIYKFYLHSPKSYLPCKLFSTLHTALDISYKSFLLSTPLLGGWLAISSPFTPFEVLFSRDFKIVFRISILSPISNIDTKYAFACLKK